MLRSVKSIKGFQIEATDGRMGKVDGFLFDDEKWIIRYLVVETGPWLFGRKVLISPAALGQPDWGSSSFPVFLTRDQVKDSPDIDLDKPVSRQREAELHQYYHWPPYWPMMVGAVEQSRPKPVEGDTHLRSTSEITGYHVRAVDGRIGHVEDFIADDQAWVIRYIVLDTKNWLPGKKVLINPDWVSSFNWGSGTADIDLDRKMIENSPEFVPHAPVNRAYEIKLYDYYGRERYWQ